MSYQDPYDPYHNYGRHYNAGDQQQDEYGVENTPEDLWRVQQSQDGSQSYYQWTSYGDPGHKSRKNSSAQKSVYESDHGESTYQYPPLHPNRGTSQKTSGLSRKGKPSAEVVPVSAPVEVSQNMGVNQSSFDNREFTPKRRTPSAYREYRYVNQGNLWTKNGPLPTGGRFCLCTVLTTLFLIVSIALSLVLWIRPPDIQIGQVQSGGGLQKLASGGFQVNLSTVIAVNNFNYFNVDMQKIQVEVFYPINNTPIGGGIATDVFFQSGSQTNFTFPFSLTYNPSNDASGQVLADIATKCGVGGQQSNISVNYKLTLGIRVLLFTLSPVVSNVFTFACPIKSSDISKIFGGSST